VKLTAATIWVSKMEVNIERLRHNALAIAIDGVVGEAGPENSAAGAPEWFDAAVDLVERCTGGARWSKTMTNSELDEVRELLAKIGGEL
jgi:hypothetical protein